MAGHYRTKVWAYTAWKSGRTPYLERFYTANQWHRANIARQRKDLEHRIRNGKAWLATIPTSDPRYPKWSCKLAALRLQFDRLTAKLDRDTVR